MSRPPGKDEYSVVVVQRGHSLDPWEWEIYRNGQQLPARLRHGMFWSERTARAAGNVALSEFLEALDREQNP
jgi:hypothetical protein